MSFRGLSLWLTVLWTTPGPARGFAGLELFGPFRKIPGVDSAVGLGEDIAALAAYGVLCVSHQPLPGQVDFPWGGSSRGPLQFFYPDRHLIPNRPASASHYLSKAYTQLSTAIHNRKIWGLVWAGATRWNVQAGKPVSETGPLPRQQSGLDLIVAGLPSHLVMVSIGRLRFLSLRLHGLNPSWVGGLPPVS